ncbi:MAG: TIGR01906 family membrane protein [Chloroflexi bacterium HGW-Chloroflexi-8]|nr:MAG: TIGR01906 family membrane protein [Chloroflexi bacterium HGW-Chloroflexi-8]
MRTIYKIASWLITITLPFFLIMFSIRVLFTPLFLSFEYNFPGFPKDSYGFSTEERMHWGSESMSYLFDRNNSSSLTNLKFEDGTNIYNDREISHMVDVKILLLQSLNIFYLILVIYLVLFVFFFKKGSLKFFLQGIINGGWFTIGLIGLIIAGIAISFDQLFTLFHKLFFTGDTWLFNYSDTLIRLFPMRLWQDAFIMMGAITLIIAIICVIYGKKLKSSL